MPCAAHGAPRARLDRLLAVVAGVAVNLGGVDLDGIAGGRLREIISTLGRIAVPLMMLSLGMSLAASRLRAPSGEGAERCMRMAMSTVKTKVDYINPHATSTPVGDVAEATAIAGREGWSL